MNVRRTAYLKTIHERLRDNPVVSLVGPRRAGKTTLARMVAEQSTAAVHFFDLESPADLARLSNPELILRPLEGLVVLDEVQRRPDLFPLLRVLADRPSAPARFLILGSASPELIKEGSDSLAGRVSFVDVTGFSLGELQPHDLARPWWRGGFSCAYLAPDLSLDHLYLVYPGAHDFPLDESITAISLPLVLHVLHPGHGHA